MAKDMKPESTAALSEPTEVSKGLWKVKLPHPKALFKIGSAKKQDGNALYLEIDGTRKFEIGSDSPSAHFWYKCLQEPRLFAQKKVVNLPSSLAIPRPLDAGLIKELYPVLEMMDRGEHYILNMTLQVSGPYRPDDENGYFFNNEFLEIWGIEDPASEDFASGWEHYEGNTPKVFRSGEILEKQYDLVIPLVPVHRLKQENISLYQQMITGGDRPRVLLYGMLQRPTPESVVSGRSRTLHSYFAGFVLDGHHKLAAYCRTGVPAHCLVVLSPKASKFHVLESETANARTRFEDRLAALAEN
jgi:hypothetical protein